ncbi:MAG: phytanoyl-CoA dioxygenase family protein [Lentisphaeria bacterium]|nr:phytanoyl-CoA dioxygenase family protein [Lentisphaeria bacterium]NQZ68430.1 phytanoyl-CoA dioxygenase family protein [Lentisphaeria bacterium]
MKFTKLTNQQQENFESDGFLIVPNALNGEQLGLLTEVGDRLVENKKSGRGADVDWAADGTTRLRADIRNLIEMDEAFLPLLTLPTTVPLIVQLLGSKIQLHTSHLIWRYPSLGGTADTFRYPNWHRDIARMTNDISDDAMPRVEIKVAYFLSDFSTNDHGQTRFAKGSHLWKATMNLKKGAVDPEEMVIPVGKAGDAVFFENRTWHAAGPNFQQLRKTIMFGYSRRWIRPDDYVKQPQELLDRCTELERSLIDPQDNFDESGAFMPGGKPYAIDEWAELHGIK